MSSPTFDEKTLASIPRYAEAACRRFGITDADTIDDVTQAAFLGACVAWHQYDAARDPSHDVQKFVRTRASYAAKEAVEREAKYRDRFRNNGGGDEASADTVAVMLNPSDGFVRLTREQ